MIVVRTTIVPPPQGIKLLAKTKDKTEVANNSLVGSCRKEQRSEVEAVL